MSGLNANWEVSKVVYIPEATERGLLAVKVAEVHNMDLIALRDEEDAEAAARKELASVKASLDTANVRGRGRGQRGRGGRARGSVGKVVEEPVSDGMVSDDESDGMGKAERDDWRIEADRQHEFFPPYNAKIGEVSALKLTRMGVRKHRLGTLHYKNVEDIKRFSLHVYCTKHKCSKWIMMTKDPDEDSIVRWLAAGQHVNKVDNLRVFDKYAFP